MIALRTLKKMAGYTAVCVCNLFKRTGAVNNVYQLSMLVCIWLAWCLSGWLTD